MELTLERDPDFWNALANEPATRAIVASGSEALDLGPVVEQPDVIPLANEHGGFIFVPLELARYELHTLIGEEGRGAGVLPAFEGAARHLFTTTDALEIVTKTPATNRAASIMARRAGFRVLFERKGAWWDGSDLTFYALSIDEWMGRDSTLEAEGRAFHEILEVAKLAAGSDLPTHADDPAHDRAVGAASLIAKAGNAPKAVWFYNRWASFAGYQTIELAQVDPPILDVRDALITVRDGALEVLKCQ